MPDHHVCPWWLAYTFDNPLRYLIHNPKKILSTHIQEGMSVMDVGCGMGFFTLGLAELVGETGQVLAVDLQKQMLDIMMKRATRKGLAHRIIQYKAKPNTIGVTTPVDFVLAFWMIHEVPDPAIFFKEIKTILKSSAKLLYTEPTFHVPEKRFNEILAIAEQAGLSINRTLSIRFSRAVLLESMA